jgi:hypothetical protein
MIDRSGWLLLGGAGPTSAPATPLDLRAAAYALALGSPALAALIGPRLFPGHTPQGSTYPQVCYRQVSRTRLGALDGPPGMGRSRLAFVCYGTRAADAIATAAALRGLFDGLQTTVATPAGSLRITAAQVDDEADGYELAQADSDAGYYRVDLDVFFNHALAPSR